METRGNKIKLDNIGYIEEKGTSSSAQYVTAHKCDFFSSIVSLHWFLFIFRN